ncbi:MAG: penicillin-binding protein 1C [Bacteroidetes bacterium]|nr:penicillin-binding protein 1C [Bacteroidota bacterium]
MRVKPVSGLKWSGKTIAAIAGGFRNTVWLRILLIPLLLVLLLRILPVTLPDTPFSTVLEDRQGGMLGARIATDGQWRFPTADSIPGKFRLALLTFEDRSYYYHPGVNPFSLARAAWQNLKAYKRVSGGSTITMQLARVLRGHRERSLWNKIMEILFAIRLECRYSKSSILSVYASCAPFGGNVVGITAASHRYFGKDPFSLSWAEAATLAVLPNAPSLIQPSRNRELLRNKRDRVLKMLYRKGFIDTNTYSLALLEPLPEKPLPMPQKAQHLLARAANEQGGRVIRTTIDPFLQERVNEILLRHHNYLKSNEIHNLAALVLDVESGSVLAYVGNITQSSDPSAGGDVDVIVSPRSTGSLLKPILFAAMLSAGELLPGTLIPDIPTQIGGFSPKNYNLSYEGAVPAKRALAKSLNIPAVKMLKDFGVERFYHLLQQLGMTTLTFPSDHYGLSLILGGAEGTLWDICGMYASLARPLNHYRTYESRYSPADIHPPGYLAKKPLKNSKESISGQSLITAGSLWLMFEALVEVNRPDEESGWRSYAGMGKVAWKTGTSFGFRDGWAVATTPRYVVGVWVGNADGEGRPGLTGIGTAAPVLFDILDVIKSANWFNIPYDDLVRVPVCRRSGHLASALCQPVDTLWVQLAGKTTDVCPYHQLVHLDPSGKYRVNTDCEEAGNIRNVPWFILPPAQEYYFRSKNAFYQTLPVLKKGCKETDNQLVMELVTLREVNQVFIPREMDGSKGRIIFQAAHRDPSAKIFWHLDNQYVGQTTQPHQLSISPGQGSHRLVLVDEEGNRFVKQFEVLDKQK